MGSYKIENTYKALLSDGIHTFQVLEFGTGSYENFIGIRWDDGSEEWSYPGDMDRLIEAATEKEYLDREIGVVIIDPQNEYKHLTEMFGYKLISINLNNSGVINPINITTENKKTLEEKENELRKLLDDSVNGSEYARHCLKDMSFLDNDPDWKERATFILKEYAGNK